MPAICEYRHKKFDLKSEEHSHKNYTLPMKKRKLEDNEEDKENIITVETILEKALRGVQVEQPLAKRRQTKPLFRPWLDEVKETTVVVKDNEEMKSLTSPKELSTNIMTYHSNVGRQYAAKPHAKKDQQRRNRNTFIRQTEQLMLQQQYAAYHQHQQAVMMDQSLRAALYMRHLQQMALQRQHQLFVFGAQH